MLELKELLARYKDKKIAIYGLGTETEKFLKEIANNLWVIGLLDSYQNSGKLYGKPIISLEQAVAEHVRLILVAARRARAGQLQSELAEFAGKSRLPCLI